MLISQGSVAIFWSNWLVGGIMTLGMLLLFWPAISWILSRTRPRVLPDQVAVESPHPHG